MKKSINTLVLACICAISSSAEGAAITLNLRSTSQPSAPRLLSASAPKSSCLQSAAFPAGATATSALSVGDVLTFLMFKDTEIRVTLSERMESPLGGEAFIGTVSGYDGVKNAVVLHTADGLTVDIQDFTNSRTYTIVSDANGVTVKEIDPSLETVTPTEPVDPGLPAGQSSAHLLSATLMSDQPTTIVDVLVAYDTPAAMWARQNGGGITNFATMAVQKMNTVLDNCGFASTFRYRLVGVIVVDAIGGTDFNGVLAATCEGTGGWAPIKEMRNTVGADIVTTLIDTGSASSTTGLGYALNRTPLSLFSESAYNVCSVRAVANGHTMTHEVGHNLGAGHATDVHDDLEPGPQLYDYSSGYYFTGTNDVAYHTIMAYGNDGLGNHYQSAPFFSSSNFTYMGTAVGDAMHDNVRTIQQTYLAASQWREQKIPMSYDVFFSPGNGTMFTDSIVVTLTPGKSGAVIRYTTDGSVPTTSSTLYTGPIDINKTTTIRAVTVTDGVAGPVFEATYYVSDIGTGVDAPQLTWRTSASQQWTFQTSDTWDGIDAVQSMDKGLDSDDEYDLYWNNESWLETTVTGPTDMSFRYKTRKYLGTFSVLVDGTAVLTDTEDTTANVWKFQEIAIPSGKHTIRFLFQCYVSDGGYLHGGRYAGFNGAWLDTVKFDALSRAPTISPTTTTYESSAFTFERKLTVTLTPPSGKTGYLYYTLDGSDPTGETQILYKRPIVLTKSTRVRAVFVEGGREPSVEVGGLYLERHPVSPGEWTTDVYGARDAAARDGRLIAVLLANREENPHSQRLYNIAESPEFLAWAKANGIYLVIGDTSCNADAKTAEAWFWQLCQTYFASHYSTDDYGSYYCQMYFVLPSNPDEPIDEGAADGYGLYKIGTALYNDTVESLVRGFASVLGATVPQPPVCSQTDPLVDSFPAMVFLANPNGSGTIYYTLDGSVPTPTNGTAYSGVAIPIASSEVELLAAVWTSASLSSPMLIKKYNTVSEWANGVFGTSGITWHRSGAVNWYQVGSDQTLRTGGLKGDAAYVSTITAIVRGKGKLIYKYKAASWSAQNVISHTINGFPSWTVSANYVNIPTVAVTNDVQETGTTTFSWTYTVNDPANDLTSGYTSGDVPVWSGVWLYDLQWIPDRTLFLIR